MQSENSIRKAAFAVFLALTLLVGLTATAWAQSAGTGRIQGRVTDPSGAAVPGAKVTIRNVETNASRTLESDEQGDYRAELLNPGSYEVVVETKGFSTTRRLGIQVPVGSAVTVNVELQVAAATEVITVTEETPITEPERHEVTSVVSQKQINDLPINGRRWDNFVLLTPGVIPDGTFGLISYRGIASLLNNNTVDGADNNQAFFSEARGRTRVAYTISQASVKEFQVGLSNFSAEVGRAAGGTVNAVTKSGTNELHGEVFYYIRDDVLQAREPTLRSITGGPLKNKDRRQQYGLTLGLPVIKDRLFFFGAFDQQLRTETYLAREGSGTFFPTFQTVCNVTRLNTAEPNLTAAQMAQLATNCTALLNFQISEGGLVPRKRRNNVALGKVDWVINPMHTLTGSYNWHRWNSPNGIQTQQVVTRGASDNGLDGVKTDSLIVKVTSVIRPTIVNEAKFQFGRDLEFQFSDVNEPRSTITNGLSFGMSEFLPRPAWPNEKRYQWIDTLAWNAGRHTLKFGMDINYVRTLAINVRNGGGVFPYTSLAGLAADCPGRSRTTCTPITTATTGGFDSTGRHWNSFTQAFDLRGQAGRFEFTTTDYNIFFQDTWKWTPTLTVNAGVRYEYQRLPKIEPSTIGANTFRGNPQFPESQKFNSDTNNVAPRLAFAWDIRGRQKNVIRAGAGVYYGRTANGTLRFAQLENGVTIPSFFLSAPLSASAATLQATLAAAPIYPNILSAPPTASGTRTVYFLAGDYVRPVVYSVDVAYDHQLFRNVSISATYLYTRGNHLTHPQDINLNPASATVDIMLGTTRLATVPFYAGVRPLCDSLGAVPSGPSCTRLGPVIRELSNLNSTYNGLIIQLTQRARWGITQTAHFTLSKAEDEGQVSGRSPQPGTFDDWFDPRNRRNEFSRSDFDTRKRFVWNFIWEPSQVWKIGNSAANNIFGDWGFSGILVTHDGQPLDVTVSGSISGSGTGATATGTVNGSGGSFRAGWFERNFLTTTGFINFDFRVQKDIRIAEGKSIRVLWEAFNLFNRTNHPSRFNFGGTGYSVLSSRTCATVAPTGGCATAASSSTNLNLVREVVVSQNSNFVGTLDPITGAGSLSACTLSNCLRSASGTLFGARDMQFGLRFIF
jgi:hypothetical protein